MFMKNTKRIRKKDVRKTDRNLKTSLIALLVLCLLSVAVYIVFFRQERIENLTEKNIVPESSKGVGVLEKQEEGNAISIGKAEFKWDTTDGKDVLRVIIEKIEGKEPENIRYQYEWSINKKPAGGNSDSLNGFKRGDAVAVKVTPYDGERPGSFKLLSIVIGNTAPIVSEIKQLKNDGTSLSYQIIARDPDGDTLSYSLVDPPAGMVIDNATGIIDWQLKDGDVGTRNIKVKVMDGKGGEAMWSIDATIEKKTNEKVINK